MGFCLLMGVIVVVAVFVKRAFYDYYKSVIN